MFFMPLGPLFEGAVAAGDWGSLSLREGGELGGGEEIIEVSHIYISIQRDLSIIGAIFNLPRN